MNFGKLVNGNVELFVQPDFILGDATEYAISNGYYEIIIGEIPSYSDTQKLEDSWQIIDNKLTKVFTVVNKTSEEIEQERLSKIPEEISKRQLKIALLTQLNIEGTQITAMISQISDDTQRKITEIEWNDGAFVKRTHPMVNLFAEQLGISQRQLDDLFTFAKDI